MTAKSVRENAQERARARETQKKKKQLIIFVVCAAVVFGLWVAFGPERDVTAPAGGNSGGTSNDTGSKEVEGVALSELLERETAPRLTRQEEMRATIEEHLRDVEANPEDEMSPSKLSAAGNTAKQLGDYAEAANIYELLLADYPEWEGRKRIFVNVIDCYDALGQEDDVRRICREMLEFFPADSNEYEWARDRLGMSPLTPEEVEAELEE